ncbi:MAG: hypothetical protein B6243_03715 [Anaerolineaceae bacterium 4572_5.2]|nr:MAG: hypothetical protein B6243_03715 [Anaerolineaceae bacterium 4572_5.2]
MFGGSRWDKEDEVEVDPKEDEVEIDPKEDEIEVDPKEDEVEIDPKEDEIEVDPKEDEVEVDPKEKEDVIPPPPPLPGKAPKKPSQWAGKTEFEKKRGKRLGTSEHLARLNQLGQKSKANTANEYLSESKAKNEKTQYSRENLLKTIKDPSSSSEDVAEAQDMLKTLHKNTGFFGSFKRNVSREATGERLKKLKEQARGGDKAAYDKYKKEYEKASTYEKYSSKGSGGKTKMIGSGILSFGKKLFGGVANDFKTQLFGAEKEEPKAPAPSPVTVNVGGAGGNVSGGLDMLAKYVKENEQLKTKIAELEKEQK